MSTMRGVAILVVVLVPNVARTQNQISFLEAQCQFKVGKAAVKFVAAKTKCVSACVARARKAPPLNPESDCFPPFGGATLTCIADPIKGAEAKAIAAINKACLVIDPLKIDCPECYSARGGGPDCSGHAEDVIVDGLSNPTAASLESQIDALGFIFCTDNPNTTAEDTCEQGLSKALVKFVSCKGKCYLKCYGGILKGTVPPGSCNPPSPGDATAQTCLFDSIKGCENKSIAAIDKACFTAPADAPECYGSLNGHSVVALVETAIDGVIPNIACGSPSGAFLSSEIATEVDAARAAER